MKKTLMKAMMTSISEVMETMFFLPVDFEEEESTLDQSGVGKSSPLLASQLKFKGDVSGSLSIFVPTELVGEMAENFMGESQDQLTDEHLTGTLTEMLNMVCGNALSKTESNVPYELDIPEVIEEPKIQKNVKVTLIETTTSKMAIFLRVD